MAIKHQDVQSSNITSVGYDKENNVLEVRFKGGGLYSYKDVPKSVYDGLMSAESVGKQFTTEVKNAGFKWEKVE